MQSLRSIRGLPRAVRFAGGEALSVALAPFDDAAAHAAERERRIVEAARAAGNWTAPPDDVTMLVVTWLAGGAAETA